MFLTGTAAEITPVREIDHRKIGRGEAGPVTRRLQESFFSVVKGNDAKHDALAELSVNKLVLGCAVLVGASFGCKKNKVTECDEFVKTVEKIAKCDKVDASARTQMESSAKQIKDALKIIEDAGNDAPADMLETLRGTCKSQEKTVIDEYTKVAPDCLK